MKRKPDIDFTVVRTDSLPKDECREVHHLFQQAYQDANAAYLEKSFSTLGYLALAKVRQKLVGFAVADTLRTPLPRLDGDQTVVLAGISCVDSDYRRMGLFSRLETMAASAGGLLKPNIRVLACGRMAHPPVFGFSAGRLRLFPSPACLCQAGIKRWD